MLHGKHVNIGIRIIFDRQSADPRQCSIESIVGGWRVSNVANCVCRDSAVLRQWILLLTQLPSIGLWDIRGTVLDAKFSAKVGEGVRPNYLAKVKNRALIGYSRDYDAKF